MPKDSTNAVVEVAALRLRNRDLERQAEFREARIVKLERANADLHSRLDELRRAHVPRYYGDGRATFGSPINETASGRLAEHMGDPDGGG